MKVKEYNGEIRVTVTAERLHRLESWRVVTLATWHRASASWHGSNVDIVTWLMMTPAAAYHHPRLLTPSVMAPSSHHDGGAQ